MIMLMIIVIMILVMLITLSSKPGAIAMRNCVTCN